MAEILTESFCERCGTRYTFESGAPKARLKGLKVMSRGFRNFVLSDDTSMDEAMAAARNETDREQTSQQLDAFHKTFNFCMSCRQYTCGNCWNEAEGRCLSCAPNLGHDVLPTPFANAAAAGMIGLEDADPASIQDRNVYDLASAPAEPLAWPTSDLMREAEAASPPEPTPEVASEVSAPDGAFDAAIAAADAQPAVAADVPESGEWPLGDAEQLVDETLPEDESFDFAARFAAVTATEAVVADDERDGEPEVAAVEIDEPAVAAVEIDEPAVAAVEIDEPVVASTTDVGAADVDGADDDLDHPAVAAAAAAAAATAAANTTDLFQRFRPGQSLDDEIEAYEREQAADAAATAAAAGAAAGVVSEPEPVAAEPAPSIAATAAPEPVYPEPEPVYPEPEPAPVETFEPEPVPAAELEPAPAWPEPVAAEAAEPAEPVAPEPAFPAGDPRVDYVPQPTWQIVAPETPPTNGVPTAPHQEPTQPTADAVAASGEPQWPDRDAAAGLPFLGRPAAATGGIEALWAASAHEVSSVSQVPPVGAAAVKPGGVQPCVSCGLSLSANARFCRRCGTRQG